VFWYLANLWSIEHINTKEQLAGQAPFTPSRSLQTSLERVQLTFANYLLRDKDLMNLILRPNIHELMNPILEAKKSRHVKTIIIYSNTRVGYTMDLAEYLLEQTFKVPRLFSVKADWWHPLRGADRTYHGNTVYTHKRIETLQLLFQKGLKTKKSIPLRNILFVDDRSPRHTLVQQIPGGLHYLVPTAFHPSMSVAQKEYIVFLAFGALHEHGLLENKEYLDSRFCSRTIHFSETIRVRIENFGQLFACVKDAIMSSTGMPWKSDSAALRAGVKAFLQQAKS
jgi:hypothetical protein